MPETKLSLPALETPRLKLRPVEDGDVEAIHAIGSDERVTRTVFWPRQTTHEHSLRFIHFLHADDIVSTGLVLAGSEELIGTCFFHSHRPEHARIELAFNVAHAYWSQGYATEAVEVVTDHALAHWPVHRIEGTCMTENRGSARVLEKAGFHLEGTMRQSHRRGATFHDMFLYAKLGSRGTPTPSEPSTGPRPNSPF